MHIRISLFILFLLATLHSAAMAGSRIDGAKARELVAAGATLLDVRTPQEYEQAHIEGAKLIPIAGLAGRLTEIPKEKPVVVYCRSGNRSAKAASLLKKNGYQVYDLGAIGNW